MRIQALSIVACVGVVHLAGGATAQGAELKALLPISLTHVANQVIPDFGKDAGHKVTITYSTAGMVTASVRKGVAADVAVTAAPQINDLQNEGHIVPGSSSVLAKVGVGVFVGKGHSKPDISSVEALKASLLSARSIVYSNPAAGHAPAANGEADFGFNMINEILADARVELVGPLPPSVQNYTVFAVGLVSHSAQQDAGRALIHFLTSPSTIAVMRMRGFE
jgi:molybdate transport system substrate-binding protein